MGMQLPQEVAGFLSLLGFHWPQADETKLLELGRAWTELSGKLDTHVGDADNAAATVWAGNASEMVAAFESKWASESSPAQRLKLGATGADIIGAGLMVCAGLVVALKLNVIVQVTMTLIAIAQAIAAAFVTFGASAALVVVLREACKRVLDWLLGEAIARVLNG